MSEAERMLELVNVGLGPKRELVRLCGPLSEECFAVITLALKLNAQLPVVRFRAIAEEWDRLRIIREMF